MKSLSCALLFLIAATPLSAATFTVDSTGDEPDMNTADGVCETAAATCTLRAAIQQTNASAGEDTIAFNIAGAGVHTITPASVLPSIADEIVIDGYTQPGSSVNTDPVGTNAVLLIEIDGGGALTTALRLSAAGAIRGLVVGGFPGSGGILFEGGLGASSVTGCFLGTQPDGTTANPNFAGMYCRPGTVVGGTAPADRNLISGNVAAGIHGSSHVDLVIRGNLVGTDRTGQLPLGNQVGIENVGTSSVIGGSAPGAGNVVSGNTDFGLDIDIGTNVTIHGNRIGTTADGSGPLGNGNDGIRSFAGPATIGGTGAGEANEIAYNGRFGYVGGTSAILIGTGNVIRGNSIHDNALLGIELGADGVTPNDAGDADGGANNRQNFPILQQIEHLGPQGNGSTRIVGKLDSAPSTTYDLDFYENSVCSNFPREFVEGRTWIGTAQVTTDGSGHADIDETLPVTTADGARISATATDPAGNTSEFSQRIIFSIDPVSGPDTGGTVFEVDGTDFADPTTITVGGAPATGIVFTDDHTLQAVMPAFLPGTSQDVVVTTPDGTTGTLIKGWVADFLDVPDAHIFHDFVVTLVSNGITAGVGGGLYGVTQDTLRQQMAPFLLRSKYGLCFLPPPCNTPVFDDVPCSSIFAPWINELVAQGITGGCATPGSYCPASPVLRQQMAALLLKTLEGPSYTPPACTVESFTDVPCTHPFATWIYDLVARGITAGCGGGLYCPALAANRGQMATFVVKTFNLQ